MQELKLKVQGGVTARFYGNSPPHMQPHKPHLELYIIAKIEGVAFPFGNLQPLESQSGTILNRFTMHSKPDLQY